VEFPFPLLVCDIGGTNTRVAIVRERAAPPELLAHLKTTDFPDLAAAVEAAAIHESTKARSLIACAAGPVQGRTLHMTNAAWNVDGAETAERLRLDQGLLLNDFEAQALAAPALKPEWKRLIGSVCAVPSDADGTRLVLGPGTGLGAGGLLTAQGIHTPLASEAGHVDFGPTDADEERIWRCLEQPFNRISAETLVSGPGLVRLHRARLAADGKAAPHLDGVTLVDRALQDRGGEEARTARMFWLMTARFASNMALVFLPRAGVILSGGVLPRLVELLDPEEFRRAFEAKAPMDALLATIPTELVVAPDAVLAGMAAIAAAPQAYALNYKDRLWRPTQAA
jgi:glucokinase